MCLNAQTYTFSQTCLAYLLHTLAELTNFDEAIFVWDGAVAG